ncbi:glycerophosphodiester phosphodiesterase family protein [Saccharospirillum impatiens]|uniref:glycerophosphodiester phosphodiesterase family protein n=1 Tax=Saccharospirillum impatiens TaxID=169438 RepID=UPI000405EA4E|nr:glycerophosphodiester phosphodiesterase family protein [Saccharospirillum impatiens]
MVTNRHLFRHALAALRYHRRPLLAFHVYFIILAFSLLSPVSGWLLSVLVNLADASLISNVDLARFLISPAGLLWILVSGTLAIMAIFLQHAGMMLIVSHGRDNRFHTAASALWRVAHRLPRLLRLAGIQVFVQLLVAAPFIALVIFAFNRLLTDYDLYYVITEQPPAYWGFLAIMGAASVVIAVVNGSLYLRWVLALPILLLEERSPRQALKRSAQLSKGARLNIGALLISAGIGVALLPILLALVFEWLAKGLLAILPEFYSLLIPVMVLLIITYAVLAVAVGFMGVSLNSLVILKLYLRGQGRHVGLPPDPEPRQVGAMAWGIEVIVVVLALAQVGYVVNSWNTPENIAITAHRGSSLKAPDNSLAAIQYAIEDGADYIELDVRQTADGHLVLLHDKDLLRLAGDPRDVWNLTLADIRALDSGRRFSPDYEGSRIPTLIEAIDLMRGRAKLYLEVKTSPQSPGLVRRVVETLKQQDMINQTLFAALEPSVLREAQRLAPEMRTSLLVHSVIGSIDGQPFDVLALRDVLISPARISNVRRQNQEIHVWTVNDRRTMSRMIDQGVDNIITDRPELLAALLAERAELSEPERLLLRLRNWMW